MNRENLANKIWGYDSEAEYNKVILPIKEKRNLKGSSFKMSTLYR